MIAVLALVSESNLVVRLYFRLDFAFDIATTRFPSMLYISDIGFSRPCFLDHAVNLFSNRITKPPAFTQISGELLHNRIQYSSFGYRAVIRFTFIVTWT
jgi:hypothetical protein